MQIIKNIVPRYMEKAAIEEYAANLRNQGYEVEIGKPLNSVTADLVATRDGLLTVYAFKSGPWSQDQVARGMALREYALGKGGKFKLVWVNPYREVGIHVDGLEDILSDEISGNLGTLDELSTHTYVDEVSDLQVHNLEITADGISVEGEAVVYVELNYGSESDRDSGNGAVTYDSFPFQFSVKLDSELKPTTVPKISIDTSSFYKAAA